MGSFEHMIDSNVIEGMRKWLGVRALDALSSGERDKFFAYKILLNDIRTAQVTSKYPWEVIFRTGQEEEAEIENA